MDPALEPYVGPEGTITVLGTLVLAWTLWQTVLWLLFLSSGTSGGKAIADDDPEEEPLVSDTTTHLDGTILLCGPSMAGKTCVFGHLIQQQQQQQQQNNPSSTTTCCTVKSIKSNTAYLQVHGETWRLLDTPGHWGPDKLLQMVPLSQVQRIVVVVDSTQPVAQAADYLYALWTNSAVSSNNNNNNNNIMIACHKSQHHKAKNTRRIKLQLRSELERLSKLKGHDDAAAVDRNWEEILNVTPLCASNVGSAMDDVQRFCWTGEASAATKR
jgi:signal recognition particle receptor subunit beta